MWPVWWRPSLRAVGLVWHKECDIEEEEMMMAQLRPTTLLASNGGGAAGGVWAEEQATTTLFQGVAFRARNGCDATHGRRSTSGALCMRGVNRREAERGLDPPESSVLAQARVLAGNKLLESQGIFASWR
ncbi:hypothetical protein E2562_022250 [Oryza meyeriana var. granulata]|uniref:Uncharacterized protein n=1 Tax=Oryza meyeriana var. granulata TaxID=110450 RepID=A0A6G1ENW4_9ORYZ|nr:hypothetical protein E2562_022250 [Oryza meyeriana var. granulata]